MALRQNLSIRSKYLFATPSGDRPYKGCEVIKAMAIEAGVTNHHIFTWTALRKQVATISQAMEISEVEQDQLAQFLGHDIRVHRHFYRLPQDTLQKAKVAKILLKANAGSISNPDDFSVDDELPLDMNTATDLQMDTATDLQMGMDTCSEESGVDEDDNSQGGDMTIHQATTQNMENSTAQSSVSNRKGERRKWTEAEKSAVLKHLQIFVQMKKVPCKADIERAIKNEQCLKGRSWRNVKDFCYNLIKKNSQAIL